MFRLRKNKFLFFTAVLLLAGFAALAFHFVAHSIHHDAGDEGDAGQCRICQFVAKLAFILLCVVLFALRLQKNRFDGLSQSQPFPFQFLSPLHGRAPPLLS